MHVDHLHTGEFIQRCPWRQAPGQNPQFAAQRHVQAVAQEADEDVRLDAVFFLMMDRPKAEIALQIAETFLDLGQSDVLPPDLGCRHRFPHEGA